MKQILFIAIAFFLTIIAGKARVKVYEYNICNPSPTGNNLFDYVKVGPSSQTLFWLNGVYINADLSQVECNDPGPRPCHFPNMSLSNFDPQEVLNDVGDQIAIGVLSGHIYADGSTGTHTTESVLEPDIELDGPCFLWSSTPTCRTIVIIDEETD